MLSPRAFAGLITVLQAFLCLYLFLPTLSEGRWLTTAGLSLAAVAFLVARVSRNLLPAMALATACLAIGLTPLGLEGRMPGSMVVVFIGSGVVALIVAGLLGPLPTTRSTRRRANPRTDDGA